MKRLAMLSVMVVSLGVPMTAGAVGMGAGIGRLESASGASGESRGVFGRIGLIGPLKAEIHVARVDYAEQERSDRRLTLGLHLDLNIFKFGKWVPYVLGATGVVEVTVPGWTGELVFDEVGFGVAYQLESRLAVEIEYREGHVGVMQGRQTDEVVPLTVLPVEQQDEYQQVTLGLAINF